MDCLLDEKKRQTTIRVLLRSASSQPITTSSSRSFRRNQDRSKVAETLCRPLMDGRITFLTSDQSGIIVLLSTQVSLPEKVCVSSVRYLFEEGEPRMLPYLLKWKKVYDAIYWFPSETCSSKRTSTFADSTNEILYRKKTLEPQAVPKVTQQCKFCERPLRRVHRPNRSKTVSINCCAARTFIAILGLSTRRPVIDSARRDLMRKVVKLTPKIDQRFQGVSQAEGQKRSTSKEPHLQFRPVCPGLSQQGEVDGEVAEQQQTRSTSP